MKTEYSALSDIAKIIAGQSPPSKSYNIDKQGIPFFQGKADFGYWFPRTRIWCDNPKKISLPNDILISVRAPVGPTNINTTKACIGRGLSAIRCDSDKLHYNYLIYYLRWFEPQLAIKATGSTFAGITQAKLQKLQIPLPPLPTQKKIADLLDTADELRQKTKAIIDHYDQLAQSLFLEMFGDPVRNPKGWEKKNLGNLGSWQSGGTPSRTNSSYFSGSIPWVSSGELNNIYIYDSREKINESAIQNSAAKIIEPGSILLGMYDTAALKSSITINTLSCNQAIAFSKLDPQKADSIYCYYAIQIGKKYFLQQQRGIRQKNLNLSMVKEFKIPIPPLPLQTQFAERIAIIEQQKELAKQSLQESEHLFNVLLQKAFKGEINSKN